ncbi:MAG: hypothetical protein HYU66_23580 [Armatimonadetes bacterium]|nr:hypothetical protein [Armatimonadota bacterium]
MAERDEHDVSTEVSRRGLLSAGAALAAGGLIFGDWSEAQAATVSAHYQNGQALSIVGQVMRRRRREVILVLKESPADPQFVNYLRSLQTDHVDIAMPPLGPGDMTNAALHQAFARLKQQGKVRFLGFAAHDNMAPGIRAATASGKFDCCLCNYNVANRGELDPVIRQAVSSQRMGFMAMKAAIGLSRASAGQFQAGLRGLLANRNIASLTLGMSATQHVDGNVAAVRARSTDEDRRFEERAAECAGTLCSFCGGCGAACPRGVAVMDYLRAGLYRSRGDVRLAEELTASIPARHSLGACNGCGQCTAACDRRRDVVADMRAGDGER